jgi:preprotein translocase subunit YajC
VSNGVGPLVPLVLLLVVGYLLLIRLPRKRAREVSELQAALTIGDQVMLTSGIFGRVEAMAEEKIDVEISPGVAITVHRGAIGKIVRDATNEDLDDDLREADADRTGSSPLPAPGTDAPSSHDPSGPDGDTGRGAV